MPDSSPHFISDSAAFFSITITQPDQLITYDLVVILTAQPSVYSSQTSQPPDHSSTDPTVPWSFTTDLTVPWSFTTQVPIHSPQTSQYPVQSIQTPHTLSIKHRSHKSPYRLTFTVTITGCHDPDSGIFKKFFCLPVAWKIIKSLHRTHIVTLRSNFHIWQKSFKPSEAGPLAKFSSLFIFASSNSRLLCCLF